MRYGGICLWMMIGLCVLADAGCGKKAPEQMDAGRFEGPVYHNDYLGMTITIPSGWSVQDSQTAKERMRTGSKIMAGSNENMQATLAANESRTVNLVTATRYPEGTPVAFNPRIQCIAEGVSHLPGIKTGGDYLFHAKRWLEAGQMKFSFPREVYTETLAGVEFHVLPAELPLMPTTVMKNEYLAAVRKGYTLLLILSYSTEQEKAELRGILDTLTLAPPARR